MTRGWFVTGTGTEVGKTHVTRGLARALVRRDRAVAAIKPIETGCQPDPLDARALAHACGLPVLADAPGLYRVEPPVAPYAATLAGHPPPPAPAELAQAIRACAPLDATLLVEGAGGLLVPLDARHSMADLARTIGLPCLVVADDGLGVLSHTLATVEAARHRDLEVAAVILSRRHPGEDDPSRLTNARILAERLAPLPVIRFPHLPSPDDDHLAEAAERSGLLDALDC